MHLSDVIAILITDNMLFLTREEVGFQTESIASDQSVSGELYTQNSSSVNNGHDDNHHHIQNATREYEIRTNRSMEDEVVHVEITAVRPDGNNGVVLHDFHQEHIQQYEEYSDPRSSEQDSEQSVSTSSTESGNSMQHEAEAHDLPWPRPRDISGTEDGQDSTFLHREEEWHVIESHEVEPQWQLSRGFNSTTRNRFSSPPEDDVYGVELRELLSRYVLLYNSFIP